MGAFVRSQQDAWKTLDKFVADPRIVFLSEPSKLEPAFRAFAQASTPSHSEWTDAYLAAFAIGHMAQVVTFDHGFSRFSGVDLQIL